MAVTIFPKDDKEIFLSANKKQSHEISEASVYNIVFLGNSNTIQTVFDAFKSYMEHAYEGARVSYNYKSLITNISESEIKNALDYFVSEKIDLIVTGQSQAIILKSLNVKIPVIVAISSNPVEFGLAENDKSSNNNFVFVEAGNLITAGERLRMYLEMSPNTKKILVLRGDLSLPGESQSALRLMELVAKKSGVDLIDKSFLTRKELNDFILNFNFSDVDALFRYPGPFMASNVDVLFGLEGKFQKPIISLNREDLESGGIMSYSANNHELGEQAAVLASRILIKQEDPAKIPIIHNYKYDLGVNLKKVKEYNLILSPDFKKKIDYTVGQQ